MQKGYIEGSNRVNREAILDAYFFTDFREASDLNEEWNEEYRAIEDFAKHYRIEYPPNGNNKFNLNLTIKPVWKKGYLQ